jgi:hypothetical protein
MRRFGRPLLEKREKGRTPSYFGPCQKTNLGYSSSLKWPTRHPQLFRPMAKTNLGYTSPLKWPTRRPVTGVYDDFRSREVTYAS